MTVLGGIFLDVKTFMGFRSAANGRLCMHMGSSGCVPDISTRQIVWFLCIFRGRDGLLIAYFNTLC